MTGLTDHGRARKSLGFLLLAIVVTATACGGSNSPSAPSGTSAGGGSTAAPPAGGGTTTASTCRTYATAATATTTASGLTQNQSLTGAFDTATTRSTVTTLLNGSPCSVTLTSYRSTADFVDEVRVAPGVTLATTAVTTTSGACGATTNTVTFSYDSQRRLTQFAGPGGTTSYSAWDSSGRPTSGTTSTGISIANVYDDAARTLTQTQINGGVRTVNTQSFDASGIQTRVVVADAAGATTSTTTFTTMTTATACK